MVIARNASILINQIIIKRKMRNKKIEEAWKLIKDKKIKFIGRSDTREIWECGDYQVTFRKKPGREICSCACRNWAKFCKENPLCKHQLAVIFMRMWRFKND